MTDTNLVVTDLARHPATDFAVVIDGRLLPVRFAQRHEADEHLADLLMAAGGKIAVAYPPVSQTAIGAPLPIGARSHNPGSYPGASRRAGV